MTPILSLDDVSFGYANTPVLDGLSLELQPGSVTGLLGRNGAGKSTLMNLALGLLQPDAGRAELFGHTAWNAPGAIRAQVGYVPQRLEAFQWMVLGECLKLVGDFYDTWDRDFLEQLADNWSLDLNKKIRALSEGQQQQAAILLALGHKPALLLLDEPVASLDPAARREFIRILIGLSTEHEQTILFSSHITSDIERIATDVAVLHRGRIRLHQDLDTLKEQVHRVRITNPQQPLPEQLIDPQVLRYRRDGTQATMVLTGEYAIDRPDWEARLRADLHAEPIGLEELFLELTV